MKEADMFKKTMLVCTAAAYVYGYNVSRDDVVKAEPPRTLVEAYELATEVPTATPVITTVPTMAPTARPTATPTVKPTVKPTSTPAPTATTRAQAVETQLKPWKSCKLGAKLQAYVISVGKAYNIEPCYIMAVIERESDFNQNCMGDSGNSFGLMQIWRNQHLERIEKLLGTTSKESLKDPYNNILVGVDILAECYKANNYSWHKALMAYNGGQGYCNKRLAQGITTSDYSEYVVKRAQYYREAYSK